MSRGQVVPLTAEQRRTRMLFLAQVARVDQLDSYVNVPVDLKRTSGYEDGRRHCADVRYRLNGLKDGLPAYNGGKDPTALDHADRWTHPVSLERMRTSDCIGGMAWCGGWDRYQPKRFLHITGYAGWINTDSMVEDATTARRCFEEIPRPVAGCYVVFNSATMRRVSKNPRAVGHIGGVTETPAEWDADKPECWQSLKIVDQAGRAGARGNGISLSAIWFKTRAHFVVPRFTT